MKDKLLISFSSGRTSAFMTWWLLRNVQHLYEMKVVFANTGDEVEQSLEFADKCDKEFGFDLAWVECVTNPIHGIGVDARIVSFETASRNGEPFEDVIAKHGITNAPNPCCSRELKGQTIRAYARQIGWINYFSAIGIRADEPKRLDWEKAKRERLVYPLVTMIKTNKSDVNKFWSKQSFDLELKSYEGNCKSCWKKSDRKLFTIASDNPERFDFFKRMENKYGNFIPDSRKHNEKIKLPITFFRYDRSVDDILEEAKFPFERAIDESHIIDAYKQTSLWDEELDSNFGCIESCEAF